MNRVLALPAPSAARTRERNKRAREEKNAAASMTYRIHNAAQGAKPWIVCALWSDFCLGQGQCMTSCIHIANTEAEAKARHIRLSAKTVPMWRHKLVMISAAPAGEVQP
jgi:hypothetical protein